ncbi:MAG: flagellin FliC [Gammaproteobacteria bacterium]|nr:flagellin FliC [Gammaproteobacteria bacterium]MCG3144214.1 Flagellin [Gammaproteobacteria bacterium]
MAAVINTNMMSLNSQRALGTSQTSLATSMARLSSGLRVNSSKDDAAGLAVAQQMNAKARSSQVAIRNANDGISMAQTAEGGMSQIGDILQRMRELAMQSANGTYDADARTALGTEYDDLVEEIDRIANSTKFNGVALINGSGTSTDFAVDVEGTDNITIDFSALDVLGSTLGVGSGDIASASGASAILADIDDAITTLNTNRATLGAAQNRLEFTINNLQVQYENQKSAYGRIMDADYAVETANLTRTQILQQAGTAMLAQANALPQSVLQLLG